jgi:hypothetical protein
MSRNQATGGFYLSYFFGAQEGQWPPSIMNFNQLNAFMGYATFNMKSLHSIISGSVKPQAFLASLNMKNAYLHVPIRPVHNL